MIKKAIILLMVVFSQHCTAQFHTNASRSELGFMVGTSFYIGDLNPFMPFRNTQLAGGILYRFNVHSRMSLRANLSYGKLKGDDALATDEIQRQRNLNFYTDIFELGVGVEFNYFPFQLGHDRYKGTAYILAEIGVFQMNPKTNYNGAEVELRPLGTEGQGTTFNNKKHYSLTQLCIPIGVGAKMSLGEKASLNFEIGLRKTFTDYIDDVGADNYVNRADLAAENGPLAAELSNRSGNEYGSRGNSSTKDWYVFAGAMLTFRLGNPAKCWSP